MRRLMKLVLGLAALLVAVVLLAGWLVLKSSLFLEYRQAKAADLLSALTKSTVAVGGDVAIQLGPTIRIAMERLKLPGDAVDDTNTLLVSHAAFGLDLAELIRGRPEITELFFDGVDADIVFDNEDKANWSDPTHEASAEPETGSSDGVRNFIAFLSERNFQASDSSLLVRNLDTGFVFDLRFDDIIVAPASAAQPLRVRAGGTINGEPVTISGEFPAEGAFLAQAVFETVRMRLSGSRPESGGDFEARLSLDIDEIADLLSIVLLDDQTSGSATLTVDLVQSGAKLGVRDLVSRVSFADGQKLDVRASIDDMSRMDGIDLRVDFQVYPEDRQPPVARTLKELKLVGLRFETKGSLTDAEDSVLTIMWNGIQLDSGGYGPSPIIARGIRRTPEGKLALADVRLLIGDPSSPLLTFEGSVGDALKLAEFDFQGRADIPVGSVLFHEDRPDLETLGRIRGTVRLRENAGTVSVSDVNARLDGSDLWDLSFKASDSSFTERSAADGVVPPLVLDLDMAIPQVAPLLTTLGLEPVDLADVSLNGTLTHSGRQWGLEVGAGAGQSRLDSNLDLRQLGQQIEARGGLFSALLELADLSAVVAALIELSKLEKEERKYATPTDDREVQPLILPREPEPTAPATQDTRRVEPLVLARPETADAEDQTPGAAGGLDQFAMPDPQALTEAGGVALSKTPTFQILDEDEFLRRLDLHYLLDIRTIRGLSGFSSIKSELKSQNGQARLGPLDFNYGGGHFNLDASMDLLNEPDILRVRGSTGGWQIERILSALKIDIAAEGVLNATFDISGNRRSREDFARTLDGSARIGMRDGALGTTLIDLAGLGVLPWLFSSQRRAGYVDITCLDAPLRIVGGTVSSEPLVLETRDVQLVAKSEIDLRNKTIYLEGRPRKIGEPLSRSPWPFTVSGNLAQPDVRLGNLPRRQWRTDGATRMPDNRELCVPDILQLRQ